MNRQADDEIVVATEQLPLVRSVLQGGGLPATTGTPQHEPRVGLSLLQLVEVDRLAQDLQERWEKLNRPNSGPEPGDDIDRVLRNVRLICEDGYAGWTPTVGKNRTMTGVQFKPYPNAGGEEEPTPVDPPARPQLSRREGDPIRVGVLDTPLYPHPVLAGRYVAEDDALLPEHGVGRWWWLAHSAFIGSLVLRHAPTAELDVRTPLRPGELKDDWQMKVWDLAGRILDYRDSGVQVLNLSLGTVTTDGKPPLVLERAVGQLIPSVVVVAAAGNHGSEDITDDDRTSDDLPPRYAAMWPAALDGVVAVGAADAKGEPAGFNPRNGKHLDLVAPWIDLLAPGVEVTGAYFGSGKPERVRLRRRREPRDVTSGEFCGGAIWSGTSFAAAVVTGAIAARIQAGRSSQEALDDVRTGRDPHIRRP